MIPDKVKYTRREKAAEIGGGVLARHADFRLSSEKYTGGGDVRPCQIKKGQKK